MKRGFRIGDFARMCGVSPRTVDYYTRLGLIAPCWRSSGQHRMYDEDAVQRMAQIKELQGLRLTLEEIASRLGRGEGSSPDALPRLQQIEGELARLGREVTNLRPELAGLTASSELRPTVVRTVAAAIAYALTLANHLSTALAEGGIPPP